MKPLTLLFLLLFTLIALFLNWERGPLEFSGPLPWIKALLWFAFAGFSAYSGYCKPTLLGFLVWAIPSLFYLNTITLLYFAIHFDSIVSRFLVMSS